MSQAFGLIALLWIAWQWAARKMKKRGEGR